MLESRQVLEKRNLGLKQQESSGPCLDVSDFKESSNHKLLHLVWRKYPRNCNYPERMATKNSSFTQTEERSSVGLLKPFTVGNSIALDMDNNSATDNKRELFYPMIRPRFLIREILEKTKFEVVWYSFADSNIHTNVDLKQWTAHGAMDCP